MHGMRVSAVATNPTETQLLSHVQATTSAALQATATLHICAQKVRSCRKRAAHRDDAALQVEKQQAQRVYGVRHAQPRPTHDLTRLQRHRSAIAAVRNAAVLMARMRNSDCQPRQADGVRVA